MSDRKIEDMFLGITCIDGYYPLSSKKKIFTDRTKNIPEGTFIKPDFSILTYKELADFYGISEKDMIRIHLESCPAYNLSLKELWEQGA